MADGEWLIELNKLESEYHKRRWNFRNKFKRFIRCNPYDDNFSEAELIEDLQGMLKVREQMKALSRDHEFKGDTTRPIKINDDIFSSRASVPVWNAYES